MSGELNILNESLKQALTEGFVEELKSNKRIKEIIKAVKASEGDLNAYETELNSMYSKGKQEIVDRMVKDLLPQTDRFDTAEDLLDAMRFLSIKEDDFLQVKDLKKSSSNAVKHGGMIAHNFGFYDDKGTVVFDLLKTIDDFYGFWSRQMTPLLKAKDASGTSEKINIPVFDAPILDGMDERYKTHYLTALSHLETADNGTDKIYGPEFKNAKERLSRAFEKCLDYHNNKANKETDNQFYREGPDIGFPSLAQVGSPIKKLTAASKTYPKFMTQIKDLLYFFHSWVQVKELIERVKPDVIKGARPTAKQIEKEKNSVENLKTKLIAGNNKKVIDLLETMAQKATRDLEELLTSQKEAELNKLMTDGVKAYEKLIETIVKTGKMDSKTSKRKEAMERAFNSNMDFIETDRENMRVGRFNEYVSNNFRYASGIKLKLKAYGETNADIILKEFIHKNVSKLANIIDEKGNLTDIKEITLTTRRGTFEGEIQCNFADGTGFKVRNKVVVKHRWNDKNQSYTVFAQYPTTFHNVVFSDGKTVKMVPEENMLRMFANINK